MLKTLWKPKDEIEYSLKNATTVSIFACGGCASLCGTGGTVGIKVLKKILKKMGKKVVFAKTIEPGCFEDLVKEAYKSNMEVISGSDTLVVSSCPAGVKAVYICDPDVPVVGVLDPVGVSVGTMKDNSVTRTYCMVCGQCVINYTGGICPVTGCPSKSKYGPCQKASRKGTQCTINPDRSCVWNEITKRNDIAALKDLRQMHTSRKGPRTITRE